MDSRRVWILVLILINIYVLYIFYTLIQQSYLPVRYSTAQPLQDQLPGKTKFNDDLSYNINQVKGSASEDKFYKEEVPKEEITTSSANFTARNHEKVDNSYRHVAAENISEQVSENDSYQHVVEDAILERDHVLQNVAQNHPDTCLDNCDNGISINRKSIYNFFESNFKVNESLFSYFGEKGIRSECDGKIKIHYKHFAILHDVYLHLHKWQAGVIEAGRELHTFKDEGLRTDEAEVLQPINGLLDIYCPRKYHVRLDNKSLENVPLLKYLTIRQNNRSYDKTPLDNEKNLPFHYESRFTIAIQREDYANFYHVMLHMHSIFSMLMVFHQQPINISILIFDAHPQAEMDEMLKTLYGPLIRVTNLKRNVKFQSLVLSLKEGKSVMSKYWINSLPHMEDFRSFVYNQYSVNENHFLNCRKLTITFIWRRDKIYHPRNLIGSIQRKIFNEAEIFKVVYDKYPNFCINGLLSDSLPMKEQLKFIAKTDILIGMHGAALTHTLFLPKTSGFIEMFPFRFKQLFHHYKVYEVIAKRRGLHYMSWENTNSEYDMPRYFTKVDPVAFLSIVDSMVHKVCQNSGQNF